MKPAILLCSLLLLAGFGLCAWCVYESRKPYKGAPMALVAAEVIAGLMLVPAALVSVLHTQHRQSPAFRRWTLPLAWASFLLYAALFALV